MDVAGVNSKGNIEEMHQIGRQTKAGSPIARERQAIKDVKEATGETPKFHPYNIPSELDPDQP